MAFKLNSAPQNWNTPFMQSLPSGDAGSTAPSFQNPDAAATLYQRLLEMGYPQDVAADKAFYGSGGGMTAQDFEALGFPPDVAQRAAQAAALSSADLPASFINSLMGDSGLGGGGGGAVGSRPPAPQVEIDPRTGELILIDHTGGVRRTGEQVGFAGIDPRDEFGESARQADNANALGLGGLTDNAAQWRALLGENAVMDRANFTERGTMDRAGLRERGVMDRASLAENARQADTGFALDEFRTRANLLPSFGQIALQASDQQRQILSGGGDYLARAYGQANQQSPLGQVTQADLSNTLMRNLAGLDSLIPESRVSGRQAFAGAPDLEVPGMTAAPGFTAPSAFSAPSMRQFAGATPAPAIAPPQAPAFTAGGFGGGGGSGGASGMGGPAPAPRQQYGDADQSVGRPYAPRPTGDADMGVGGPYASAPTFSGWGNPEAADNAPRAVSNFNYRPGADYAGKIGDFFGWLGSKASTAPFGSRAPYGTRRYEKGTQGGFTTEPAFLGNEKGAEFFINPTGAPIAVVDAKTTEKMGFKAPGYDEGTGGGGADPVRWLQMMQRMGIEDMGGMGGAAAGVFGPKGPQVIDPRLAKAALLEMRAGDIVKRLGQAASERKGFRLPGFATGTFDATAAINNWNSGDSGALASYNAHAQYGAAPPSGNSSTGWSLVNGVDPYANVGKPGDPVAEAQRKAKESWYANAPDLSGVASNEARADAMRAYMGLPPLNKPGYAGYTGPGGAAEVKQPGFFGQMNKQMTQEELIAMAKQYAPPRVMSVFNGQNPGAPFIGAGLGPDFRAPTARMLAQLNEDDMRALGTLTNVASSGKTTLADLLGQAQSVAAPQFGGRAARVRGLGL